MFCSIETLAMIRSIFGQGSIAALPGMVATGGFLQTARGIELIGPLRRLERDIESFQLRFLVSEVVRRILV
jgi:hypothetical protein